MSSFFSRYAVAIVIAVLLQACGGGGGGGGGGGETSGTTTQTTPTTLPTPDTVVSGNVQAPGGQVALLEQSIWTTRLASIFISASRADVAGLANVPDGTAVELVRVDAITGTAAGAPLATTSVSAGRYFFNLTNLRLDYSTTLQARLASATGIQMRTFVTSSVANLDPNSEAGVQLVLASIAARPGSSLAVISVKELDDLAASMDMLTSAAGVAAGSNTASTVSAVKTALNARPELNALLNTKLSAGHAETSPGDLANYFPLATGDTWTYSVSVNGAAAVSAEVVTVGTATQRNAATAMPVSNSTTTFPLPPPGGPAPVFSDTDYYFKGGSGLISFGNSTDPAGITALAFSYVELKLPAKVGDAFVAVNNTANFDLGLDLDGDGISETISQFKLDKLVTGYQSITVPAGTFRCLVVETHMLLTVVSSASKLSVTATGTVTWFLAPDFGIVRTVEIASGTGSNGVVVPQITTQRDLVAATVGGVNIANRPPAGTQVKTVSLLHNDLAYDKTRNLLYASIPGQVANGNSIAVINPDTGTIVQTIPVGPEPLRLALSKGDEYLYVGLDGSGEVARINLATMDADLKFSLGLTANFFASQLYVGDIVVLPNNPLSIVVSEIAKSGAAGFAGIAVFDGAVKRTNQIQGFGPVTFIADAIAISDDGAFVYGIDNDTTSFEFTRFSLAPTGISFLDRTDGLAGGFESARIRFSGGRLYLTNGRVIDPANRLLMGTYSLGNTVPPLVSCIPDPAAVRAYCLSSLQEISTTITLVSFDRVLFAKLAAVDTKLPTTSEGLGTMVRFGARGFAVGASANFTFPIRYDKIYLITSDIAL